MSERVDERYATTGVTRSWWRDKWGRKRHRCSTLYGGGIFSGNPISSQASRRAVSQTFSCSFAFPIVSGRNPGGEINLQATQHHQHEFVISSTVSLVPPVNSPVDLQKVILIPKRDVSSWQ